jgi:hypothetical protein
VLLGQSSTKQKDKPMNKLTRFVSIIFFFLVVGFTATTTEAAKVSNPPKSVINVTNAALKEHGISISASFKKHAALRRQIAAASGMTERYRGTYKQNVWLLQVWKEKGFPKYDPETKTFQSLEANTQAAPVQDASPAVEDTPAEELTEEPVNDFVTPVLPQTEVAENDKEVPAVSETIPTPAPVDTLVSVATPSPTPAPEAAKADQTVEALQPEVETTQETPILETAEPTRLPAEEQQALPASPAQAASVEKSVTREKSNFPWTLIALLLSVVGGIVCLYPLLKKRRATKGVVPPPLDTDRLLSDESSEVVNLPTVHEVVPLKDPQQRSKAIDFIASGGDYAHWLPRLWPLKREEHLNLLQKIKGTKNEPAIMSELNSLDDSTE